MLYEKSLSRKVVSISSKPQDETGVTTNGNENGVTKPVAGGMLRRSLVYALSCFRRKTAAPKEEMADEKSKELATTGKIMNLMRFVLQPRRTQSGFSIANLALQI